MEKEKLIELYNPANAKNLTDEDVRNLSTLSDDDLKTLAEAYPNQPSGNNYLILKDTKLADNKQTYQQSTFSNLYNLRSRHGKKNFVAVSFQSIFKYPGVKNLNQKIPTSKVQDLSSDELKSQPGIANTEVNKIPVGPTQQADKNPDDNFEDLSNEAEKNFTQNATQHETNTAVNAIKAEPLNESANGGAGGASQPNLSGASNADLQNADKQTGNTNAANVNKNKNKNSNNAANNNS